MTVTEASPGSVSPEARQFVTTHWSAVLSAANVASPQAQAALAELCQAYWYPLYAYVRHRGHSSHDAEDLTQAFFAKLLEKNYLAGADREKGRFRSFLLLALKRFLANEWDRKTSAKRGGTIAIVSWEREQAESRYQLEPAHGMTADRLYERRWAQTLLDQVLLRLGDEYAAAGKSRLFEALRDCLSRQRGGIRYAILADRLGSSEASVKMAVHRLRTRYRQLLRLEIAKTVRSAQDIEEEIRHLFATFTR